MMKDEYPGKDECPLWASSNASWNGCKSSNPAFQCMSNWMENNCKKTCKILECRSILGGYWWSYGIYG